jgi:crotonobetainyl-CoA:carnitine CoA-transferase CaiB-like acyl-CoA transferase
VVEENMVEDRVQELAAGVGIELPPVRCTGDDPVLPSVFRVGAAAAVAVGAATAAAAALLGKTREVAVDVREAAVAFRDERYFRIDGATGELWAELSGDYRTADGWVRLHCNFDHHRDAVLAALGLPAGADRDAVAQACASRTAVGIEESVAAAEGCAAAMRSRAEWREHPQAHAVAESPLIGLTRIDDIGRAWSPGEDPVRIRTLTEAREGGEREPVQVEAREDGVRGRVLAESREGGAGEHVLAEVREGEPGARGSGRERPLSGVRVLDLTRVLAGPVATRFLAAHGAQVLRVGAEHLPEVSGLVISTAFGKRSCRLDLRTPAGVAALRDLVTGADVFVQSYRPGALEALGFGPRELAALRPGIVCVDISAYGSHGPWAGRRGFDSLVQMACGIAHEGGDGSRPHPLPAQVLDHATGYLAAFGAMAALLRRPVEGGSWRVRLSLARTAQWLDGFGRVDGAGTPDPDVADLMEEMDSTFGRLAYLRPPGTIDGASPYWSSPPPRRGEHPPAWW